jgi:hypothetical protein
MNEYIRDDGVLMREVAPGNFVRVTRVDSRPEQKKAKISKPRAFDTNATRVFEYLEMFPEGLTADECAHLRESDDKDGCPKVNSVAPFLTVFKKHGIVEVVGHRPTRNGSLAGVHRLTTNAHELFKAGAN